METVFYEDEILRTQKQVNLDLSWIKTFCNCFPPDPGWNYYSGIERHGREE
jgi:hypothetical protein